MLKMSMKASFFFKTHFASLFRVLFRQFKSPKVLHRNVSSKYQKFSSLVSYRDLSKRTLVFNLEGALLRSSSLFPYFMLVAFEAGSLLRAFLLYLLYPIICLVNEEIGLKIMVMVCFFGIKKGSFRVGKSVLPKFFLEDVGLEMFEFLNRGGKKVAVSDFPQVMIESLLRDYLQIDVVVGRELKVCCGYFVGLLEEKKKDMVVLEEIDGEGRIGYELIGISSFLSVDHHVFSHCKEIYVVRRSDKRSWQQLPREKYPKPLIFHDGRLAFRPTPSATFTMFVWFPFGLILAIIRAFVALCLPYDISIPILAFSGLRLTATEPKYCSPNSTENKRNKGLLYVCNHRTLLDPLYVAFTLKKDMVAVTYSLSRMSEILSPIRTVRLTRNRDRDGEMMEKLLNQGDLVVCPEGTTCREPYLLRFSPLFAEMSDVIVPIAVNTHVNMFYGTTASGLKCLDPFFFLMNPSPSYTVQILESVSGPSTCPRDGELSSSSSSSRFDIANHVQSELGKALNFQCTKLTRKDKYLILAGNEGKA